MQPGDASGRDRTDLGLPPCRKPCRTRGREKETARTPPPAPLGFALKALVYKKTSAWSAPRVVQESIAINAVRMKLEKGEKGVHDSSLNVHTWGSLLKQWPVKQPLSRLGLC